MVKITNVKEGNKKERNKTIGANRIKYMVV